MLLKNATALITTQLAGRVIRFIYMLVLARLLGPEEVGVYLYGIALYISALAFAEVGQNIFLSQRLGKHASVPKAIIRNSFVLVCCSTALVSVVLAAFILLTEPDDLVWIVFSFVGALIARAFAIWVRFVFTALQEPGWIPRFEVTFRGGEVVLGVLILLSGGGLAAVCLLHFATWVLEAYFSLARLVRMHPGVLRFNASREYLKKVAAVSVIFVVGTVGVSMFAQSGILLLRHIHPDQAFVGQFGIAMQFLTTLLILPMTVGAAFLPRLARAYRSGDGGGDLVIGAKLLGATAIVVSIVTSGYGPPVIVLLLGDRYAETGSLFGALSWIYMPYALAIFVGQCLNVIDKRYQAASIMMLMLSTQVILFVSLVPDTGTVGIFIALLAGSLMGMSASIVVVHRHIGVADHLWPVKLIVIATVAYLVGTSGWGHALLMPVLATASAVALLYVLRVFDDEDVAAATRVLRRTA